MAKQKWMAITITTVEALHIALAKACRLFCVDDPLYWEIRDTMHTVSGAEDYEITYYDDLGFAMFKRIQGEQRFDDELFEPYCTTLIL